MIMVKEYIRQIWVKMRAPVYVIEFNLWSLDILFKCDFQWSCLVVADFDTLESNFKYFICNALIF